MYDNVFRSINSFNMTHQASQLTALATPTKHWLNEGIWEYDK